MRRFFLGLCSLSLIGLSACFVVTDLGRFEEDNTPIVTANDFTDLRISLKDMAAHASSNFEYRVVDDTNTIQSFGIIQPLGNSETSIFAQRAVPKANGPFHVDLYVMNNGAAGPGWRVNLDEATRAAGFAITVDKQTATVDVNAPSPPAFPATSRQQAIIRLQNMKPYEGRRVEVRIADATSHTVGLFRVPKLAVGVETLDATVPQVIAPSASYQIEIFTDDGGGTPSSSASIAAFRFAASSTATGLESVWNANIPGRAVGDAPPP